MLKLFWCSVFLSFIQINNIFPEKIIDLTWKFDDETIYWSGVKPFNYTKRIASSETGFWYAANEFEMGEHGGTHLDAPYHFNKNGWKVADIPVERLFVHAVLLDFTSEAEAAGPDYVVDTEVLKQKLNKIEQIENNTVLLFKFGWSKYWPNKRKYLGKDEEGTLHFPGLGNASAAFIVSSRKFVGVGVDIASIDAGSSKTFISHQILLENSLYALENTKLDENFPEKYFRLIVAPIKLADGTGAPVRLLAMLKN